MIREKPEIARMVDAVYRLTENLGRGDVLTHDQIAPVLGVSPHEGSWDHVVRKAARRLERERGIALWPNVRGGYRLCTVREQLALPAERLLRGGRQARKGRRAASALPDKDMTFHQRRSRVFVLERVREAELAARRERRAMRVMLTPTDSTPRRPAAVPEVRVGRPL